MSEEPPAGTRYCRECGAELGNNEQFCTECGTPQGTQEQQPQQGGQQPPAQQPPGGPQAGGQQPPARQQAPPQAEDDSDSALKWILIGACVLFGAIPVLLILAAVVAAFVLGLGDGGGTITPQASFTADYSQATGELTVTVSSGDTMDPGQVTLAGEGFNEAGTTWETQAGTGGRLSAGDEITLTGVQQDFELRIRWQSEDGTDSATLDILTGPDA